MAVTNAPLTVDKCGCAVDDPEDIMFGAGGNTRTATNAKRDIDLRVLGARSTNAERLRLPFTLQHQLLISTESQEIGNEKCRYQTAHGEPDKNFFHWYLLTPRKRITKLL